MTNQAIRVNTIEPEVRDGIAIRLCHGLPDFEACVELERKVWGSADIDVVPIPLFVVAAETGGQVISAFEGDELVGFTMAIAGWRGRRPFLHSHMTAVEESFRNQGIGYRLKLFQRREALIRGIPRIEWTFDPIVMKNAYFNLMRLGAIVRRYLPNVYGLTSSPLHGSLPTDRLVAEWDLRSTRVVRVLARKRPTPVFAKKAARIVVKANIEDHKRARLSLAMKAQSEIREQFLHWFGKGYAATAVARNALGAEYILEPWKKP